MKRWFVSAKEYVPKRQARDVQTAQQSKTSLTPRALEGRKRSRVEGGVAKAAGLSQFKKVKEAAET